MSVQISYKKPEIPEQWLALKNGAFAILQGNQFHPVPEGLYRIFVIIQEESQERTWMLLPMFEGEFELGMFPYMIPNQPAELPTIKAVISSLKIEASV